MQSGQHTCTVLNTMNINITALENIFVLSSEVKYVHTMWSGNLTPRLFLLCVPGDVYKNVQNSTFCNSKKTWKQIQMSMNSRMDK